MAGGAQEKPEVNDGKIYVSYNEIHKICQNMASKILKEFDPNLMIAIGGGGFIPARILRTFLKEPGKRNIPIQAIGLSLYEDMGQVEEKPGHEVVRTQWLDFGNLKDMDLIGKRILIVDEVDDTRRTLHYALHELKKDVAAHAKAAHRENEKTEFAIFVVHNKLKPKFGELEIDQQHYYAGNVVDDAWINYPWESRDIDAQTAAADEQARLRMPGHV